MGKTEVITVEQARKAGGALKQVATSLQGLSERKPLKVRWWFRLSAWHCCSRWTRFCVSRQWRQ
jgi:hypothetical protein